MIFGKISFYSLLYSLQAKNGFPADIRLFVADTSSLLIDVIGGR